MNAIELKNVCFAYDGQDEKTLDGVNMTVAYGEIAVLSGLSGEGKSTLLSIVSGIVPNIVRGKLSGEVLVDGKPISGQKISQICRSVGVVLQNADSQMIHRVVEDEIAFGCENFAMPRDATAAQIDRVCKLMRLDKRAKTRSLSGGQKQRLITASTLATGQRILLLDEPLANLDKACANELMTVLEALAAAGYAVLVIEHRLDVVLPFADSVFDIRSGKVTKVEDKDEYLRAQSVEIADDSAEHEKGEPLIKLDGVAYSVKGKSILEDVNFEICRGERILLLGENGCGKTTLLRLIARSIKPSRGSIEQNIDPKFGKRCRGKKQFGRVGVVYQNPNYQLFMPTVEKEIAFNAASKEYAERMIELFGLEKLRKRHPQSLSEGQKRRVSIAAVAACAPQVLLLDEPTVGQDYKGLCALVKILNELHDESGNTVITVTHDIRCAAALCDRALVVADGKIREQGGKELVTRIMRNS